MLQQIRQTLGSQKAGLAQLAIVQLVLEELQRQLTQLQRSLGPRDKSKRQYVQRALHHAQRRVPQIERLQHDQDANGGQQLVAEAGQRNNVLPARQKIQ